MIRHLETFASSSGWRVRDDLQTVLMDRAGKECSFMVYDPASLPFAERYKPTTTAQPRAILASCPAVGIPLHEIGTVDPADDIAERVAELLTPFLSGL